MDRDDITSPDINDLYAQTFVDVENLPSLFDLETRVQRLAHELKAAIAKRDAVRRVLDAWEAEGLPPVERRAGFLVIQGGAA